MRSICRFVVTICAALLCAVQNLPAQSAATRQNPAQTTGTVRTLPGLDATVYIDADQLVLRDVIQSVAQQASLRVTFGAVVSRDPSRIT